MPKPVYALVGPDALLQQEALHEIVAQLPSDVQRIDADGETAALADVLDELRSFAMFGSAKVVAVRNADEFVSRFREQLEDYVAQPSDSATLVLRFSSLPSNQRIYKAITKSGQVIPCQPPKDLKSWVIQRAKASHRLTVSPDAAELLTDFIGADLGRIDNELAKLALASESSRIGPDEISQSVAFQREREMWDLTNALAGGNPAEAVRRWRQLVQSDSSAEFRAVTWLCIWLENVRKALAMFSDGQNAFTIGQALRIWPREMQQKFVDTVRLLGERGRKRAVDLLAEIDFQTKTGVGDAAENVERFLLSLATDLNRRQLRT
ncbi:MAG TPA: DNA polymerase III subunit delta [Tepidisphaeraceae bacterium]|jgi:DNA polymerase III delta subunit|nr:DNA polymerase III subunit delta [Tepidisphaeraceae bacterium]